MACCLTHVPLSPSQNSQPALNTRITTKSIRLHVIFGNHLQRMLFLTHFYYEHYFYSRDRHRRRRRRRDRVHVATTDRIKKRN
jgi:hypothetical protein